jgi:hypothetical protein
MIIPAASLLLFATTALAQGADISEFVGTWSSGSGKVVTGPGFADPAQVAFKYPDVSGISFSFSDDSYFEIARYRFVSNGTEPNCIKGVLAWLHGKFEIVSNGSVVMTPNGDGYQQIQDPCGAISNFIENYNKTELYQTYAFSTDTDGRKKLQLFQFDGAPLAPMYQVSATPNMLPTERLRNVSVAASSNLAIGAGEKSSSVNRSGAVLSLVALGLSSLLI